MNNNYHNPETGPKSPEIIMGFRLDQIFRATDTIAAIYETATTQIPDAGVDQAVSLDQLRDLNDRINRGEL